MIQQGFYITKEVPQRWWIMAYYNIATAADLDKVYGSLLAAGASREKAREAADNLSRANTGYTFTSHGERATIICIASATNYGELFNTVTHEISHATAHICQHFKLAADGEDAAYIQGEIGNQMYEAVALSICPQCNCGEKMLTNRRKNTYTVA